MLPLLPLLLIPVAVDRFAPDGARADDGTVAPHLGVSALVLESWSKDPVVLRSSDGTILSVVVPQQLTSTVAVAVGLFDRFELSVRAQGYVEDHAGKDAATGLLPPRLSLQASLFQTAGVAVAARGSVDVPVRSDDVLSFAPALLASVALPFVALE
ncbi:MAG TPA: hypothetical protein VGO62_00840, partial [Myxococcota bacterium]